MGRGCRIYFTSCCFVGNGSICCPMRCLVLIMDCLSIQPGNVYYVLWLSVCLSVCLFICLSISLFLSHCLSVCLSICLFVCLFACVCLSIHVVYMSYYILTVYIHLFSLMQLASRCYYDCSVFVPVMTTPYR